MISRQVLPFIFIYFIGIVSYAQQPAASSPCRQPVTDVGRGDVTSPSEYEPVSVTDFGGRVSGALVKGALKGIPQICLALFTNHGHNIVATAVTDKEGYFLFSDLPAGRYRIVIRAPGFYVAEIPVRVVRKAKGPKSINIVLQPVAMQFQQLSRGASAGGLLPKA